MPEGVTYRPEITSAFYDEWGEREWDRLDRSFHDQVNFRVHQQILDETIEAGDEVLEAGAGPGRFTIELARLGAKVHVGDLSEVQLRINQQKVTEAGAEESVLSRRRLDISDLTGIESGRFDATVCFGSALGCVLDKVPAAVGELVRVTRPGGLVMISVTSRFGFLRAAIGLILQLVQDPEQLAAVDKAVSTGDNANIKTQTLTTHFFTWQELTDLLVKHGCEIVTGATANFLTARWPELRPYWFRKPEVMEAFMRWELEACRAPGAFDCGTHIITVARRLR
ncbi:MAG TPA: class I SAM-dependent methyltransferase [Streptosporangiaceae bacterium]